VSSAFTRQVSLHTAAQRSQNPVDADGLDFLVLSIVVSFTYNISTIINISTNVEMSKTRRRDPENKW
jgi:hypothetical protein